METEGKIVRCHCSGCGVSVDSFDTLINLYYWVNLPVGKESLWKRLNKAWYALTGKEWILFDVVLTPESCKEFQEELNRALREVKNDN